MSTTLCPVNVLSDKLLNGVISNEMYKTKQGQFISDKNFLYDRLEQLESVEIDREVLNQRMKSIENELSGGV